MMSPLVRLLIKVTGNGFAQQTLQRIVNKVQYLMGIGFGTDAETSGEEGVFQLLRQRSQAPYCIFDVGANKGQYLRLLFDCFENDKIDVHCFEPGKSTYEALRRSAPESPAIKLNNIALGKICGETQLYYDKTTSGLASLTKRRLDHFNIDFDQSETIAVDTVDNYCSNNNIGKIDLLKIDVEGHELDVLTGANSMLTKQAIEVVSFEFGGCNIDTCSYFQDFYYFFKSVGMRIFRITPSGYLYPIDSYLEIYEQFRTTNFVAIRNHGDA